MDVWWINRVVARDRGKVASKPNRLVWLSLLLSVVAFAPSSLRAQSRRAEHRLSKRSRSQVGSVDTLDGAAVGFGAPTCRVLDQDGAPLLRMHRGDQVQLVAQGLVPETPVSLWTRGRRIRDIRPTTSSELGEARLELRGEQVPFQGSSEGSVWLVLTVDAGGSSALCQVQFYERFPSPLGGTWSLLLTGLGLLGLGGAMQTRRARSRSF